MKKKLKRILVYIEDIINHTKYMLRIIFSKLDDKELDRIVPRTFLVN